LWVASESGWGNAPSWRRNSQKLANTFAVAAGNMKILVVNNSSKNGAGRPAGTLRRKAMTGPKQQVTTVIQNSNLVHFVCIKPVMYSSNSAFEHSLYTLQWHPLTLSALRIDRSIFLYMAFKL
jgi:hypothetical protein